MNSLFFQLTNLTKPKLTKPKLTKPILTKPMLIKLLMLLALPQKQNSQFFSLKRFC
jgi:hypothetical protein